MLRVGGNRKEHKEPKEGDSTGGGLQFQAMCPLRSLRLNHGHQENQRFVPQRRGPTTACTVFLMIPKLPRTYAGAPVFHKSCAHAGRSTLPGQQAPASPELDTVSIRIVSLAASALRIASSAVTPSAITWPLRLRLEVISGTVSPADT